MNEISPARSGAHRITHIARDFSCQFNTPHGEMPRMKKMFFPYFAFICVIALMSFCGCETTKETPGSADATASLAQQKDLAQQWAKKLKDNKSKIGEAALNQAEEKYREAASQNKGYLEAVGDAIIRKQDPSASETYKRLAKKSEDSTRDFLSFAKAKLGAEAAPQRFVGAGVAAGILVEAGITIWKETQAKARAEREADANRFISRNTWEDWDKIQ
jgi:hypothetical protein